MDLAIAKAVITGGASGLGFATAERVIAAGGQVVLMDVNEEQGATRASELGERALFVRTDVADEADVKAAIQSAKEFMGRHRNSRSNTGTRRNVASRDLQSGHSDQSMWQLQRHKRSRGRHAIERCK